MTYMLQATFIINSIISCYCSYQQTAIYYADDI